MLAEGLRFPYQQCLKQVAWLLPGLAIGNSFLYLILSLALLEYLISPPPMGMSLAQYAVIGRPAGPGPAIFILLVCLPYIALRGYEVLCHAIADPLAAIDFEEFDQHGLLKGLWLSCVLFVAAWPGLLFLDGSWVLFSAEGLGASILSVVILVAVTASVCCVPLSVLQASLQVEWRRWLMFVGATLLLVGLYVLVYFVIKKPGTIVVQFLIDRTISASGWISLLLMWVTTTLMWTVLALLPVCFLMSYARILGRFLSGVGQLERDRKNLTPSRFHAREQP